MYSYEKFNPRIFPIFMLIISIPFLLSKMYIEAGVTGTFGAVFSVSFIGFNIDCKQHRIRQYDRFLWFYIGRWREFPTPLYVTVVRIKVGGRRNNPLPLALPGEGRSARTYKLSLIVDGKERFISLTRGPKDKMISEGIKLARALNIKMLDHTTSEKHWII